MKPPCASSARVRGRDGPDEVGRKIVAGLVRGDGLILTHPEFADDCEIEEA
jgi:hypothetical protein